MKRLAPGMLALAAPGVAFAAGAMPTAGAAAVANHGSGGAAYIVQARSTNASMKWLTSAGVHGAVALPVVHGAVAHLTSAQLTAARGAGLAATPDSSMRLDGSVTSTCNGAALPAGSHPSVAFLGVTGATQVFARGDIGQGVTVAVLDTGIDSLPDFQGRIIDGVDLTGGSNPTLDAYGHGTFVAGLIASDGQSSHGQYLGEAPGARLVSIKVAGANGSTSETTVIAGIQWAIAHRATDKIRVLNISLGAPPSTPSYADPLDQAVEQAWEAGIVVVTSAGNSGPYNGSITSPGDDPLAITVGALDDGGGTNPANFSIPSFSSVGPTMYDAGFKPDIIAPGRSVISLKAPGSTIAQQNPQACIGSSNFVGSGTSFSTAIVSGMVALMLEQQPNLTPNQVKAALLAGTTPGPSGNPFVDGHGIANAVGAITESGLSLNQQGAASLEQTVAAAGPGPVSLGASWTASPWNPSNWSGAAWNGAAWNGAAWNGAAWNGAAWNGAAWNGAAWNGAAWNGAAWNGAAWNGAAWNGAAWNDSDWS
jgi:serine protease AprX